MENLSSSMNMNNDLLTNLDKIHTTKLGTERIKKNLGLDTVDVIAWCRCKIESANDIIRKGKNWYVYVDNFVITINTYSFTIITAHKEKKVKEREYMSDWKPNLYLEFGRERTQPSIDLVARIDYNEPKRIIDIGCGPGNSTSVLKMRWANAEITGLDNSESMISEAKSKYPDINWLQADASGNMTELGKFDIIFSNAAIQWISHQETLLVKLFSMLIKEGILAVQVPCTKDMHVHTELEKLISKDKWKNKFLNVASTYSINMPEFYYNILCNLTEEIDLWETNYFHIMNSHADIIKWYSGSGLRPYLDCLKDESINIEFLKEYEDALKDAYPVQSDGKVLFPFTRIFFMAKK